MTLLNPVEMFRRTYVTKKCSWCHEVKELRFFYSNRHTPDKHSPWCQVCHRVIKMLDGRHYEPHSYIKDADPPRTLQESFKRAELRRKAVCSHRRTC